jgi:hypothetical protein
VLGLEKGTFRDIARQTLSAGWRVTVQHTAVGVAAKFSVTVRAYLIPLAVPLCITRRSILSVFVF